MPYTILRQTVADFARWRRAFEAQTEARAEAGSRGGHIFRAAEDRREVVVFLAWKDLATARRYLDSEEARRAREQGGAEGKTDIIYLEEVGRPSR